MIKTIILDFGGVLFVEGANDFMKKVAERYNLPFERVLDVIKGQVGREHRAGRLSSAAFWDAFKSALTIHDAPSMLSEMWAECYTPMPGMFGFVDDLRRAGYRVIYLSNNMPERALFLEEKYRYGEKFDGGVFSFIVGANKPEEKIYLAALEMADADAHECIFVDDKEYYLPPATALGMSALLFVNEEKLRNDFKRLGVVC